MRLRRVLVAIAGAVLALVPASMLGASASAGATISAPAPLHPGQRVAFRGYSVLLPLEGAWRVLPRGAFDVGLLGVRSPTHSFGMTASTMEVERPFATPLEFLAFMRQRLEAEADRARFSAVAIDAALEPSVGPMCVRARSRARDHGAGGHGGDYLVLEISNLTCVHPRAPGLAVSVVYFERHAPTELPGAVRTPGRRFVESLRFDVPL